MLMMLPRNMLGGSVYTLKEKAEALVVAVGTQTRILNISK